MTAPPPTHPSKSSMKYADNTTSILNLVILIWCSILFWAQAMKAETEVNKATDILKPNNLFLEHSFFKCPKTSMLNIYNTPAISPAFACVLDLPCRTQTNALSAQQKNSLCNASSVQTWFSSLHRAGYMGTVDTVPTKTVRTARRSCMRRPGWR